MIGLLRPQLLGADRRRCRIALLAAGALLLGGDEVYLDVRVGPDAVLELVDVTATVAYHGRGRPATWRVSIELAAGATLRYPGAPLVVADGADVTRSLRLELARGARVRLRETAVLGRWGERGGRLRSQTHITQAGQTILLEEQDLDPAGCRTAPGLLGEHRVIDSVWTVGEPTRPVAGATDYALVGDAAGLTRWLGSSPADSPLQQDWPG